MERTGNQEAWKAVPEKTVLMLVRGEGVPQILLAEREHLDWDA